VAVNVLVMGEVAYLFNCRYLTASALSINGLFGSRKVLIAVLVLLGVQVIFTYWPPMQTLFGTATLDAAAWLRILLFGVTIFAIVELEKIVLRQWFVR
jgi:magnesium-transporting ATPase (P-type)